MQFHGGIGGFGACIRTSVPEDEEYELPEDEFEFEPVCEYELLVREHEESFSLCIFFPARASADDLIFSAESKWR